MAKPNYAFQKRQRELAKKQKKEEKRQRKSVPGAPDDSADTQPAPNDPGAPAPGDDPGKTPA